MKRPKEKQSSRSGNVRVLRPVPPPQPFDPETSSESLHELAENARVSMQHAVDATVHFSEKEIADTILVVLDGTSPIAPLTMREHGRKMFGSNLVPRHTLIDSIKRADSEVAKRLAEPAKCGHLQYFISTALGGDIRCTVCDLQLKPVAAVGAVAGDTKDAN